MDYEYESAIAGAMEDIERELTHPVSIDLVAFCLHLASAGDRNPDDIEKIGHAMGNVAQRFDIPIGQIRRYLEVARDGDEWSAEKVQMLLDQYPVDSREVDLGVA
ncbi:hypothetical protein M1555_02895 [Patescibacteria group bacterium]|nr:hypothetical protein [Patescibacteria group bacterium]